MTEGQNDGMMNAKPKSNISKWGFIPDLCTLTYFYHKICFSIDNDKGR